ncbi:MAG: Asp-tRNA(Asn)/Glu-tRNA(Gln) amidotransferase subunit GatA [Actinobacteria bacterium]|nr:Asp-tRNA(Asn)/Glu-tRNA(Gln) amidotransferase subunit GatA [Actinomycetota bacterium]
MAPKWKRARSGCHRYWKRERLNLLRLTATEALELMGRGEISSAELTEASLSQIERHDRDVFAYLKVTAGSAREEAAAVDAQSGSRAPLAGLPTAIKDVLCTRGVTTTCASKMLEDYNPIYTATCVQRMIDAGIVTLGKTNMDEFAMGSSTENSAYGPTRNPWDLERVPGGSSGGSAAAVAAGECVWALGSDTGGSIRQPAAFCGVVGLKPTYGSVSRYGLIAFASSFDQVGPITKNVRDAHLMLQFLVGKDPLDSTSVEYPVDIPPLEDRDLTGIRLGVVKELVGEGFDAGVREIFNRAVARLEAAGAEIGEASLPHAEYALPAYYILAPAEASANLARFDGVRYGLRAGGTVDITEMYEETRRLGFGDEVKRRIMLGTHALSSGYYDAYYGQAQKVRTLIVQDFAKALSDFDMLISPTAPTTAFRLGEKTGDPLTMYKSDICTIPVNLAGLPAISIPAGLSEGLPVGLQIIGKAFTAPTLLQTAYSAEAAIGFDKVSPLIEGQD